MSKVIVIEDSSFFSGFVCKILNKENIETVTASNLAAAKKLIEKADQTDIVLADLRLPDGNSTDLLEWMNKQGYHQPFIMMTEHAEVLNTVLSFRLGSVDYIPKKLITDRLLDSVTEQMEKMGRLRQQEGQMICQRESPAFKQLYREIEMFARSNIRVMIMGESGTGKEHIAEIIHRKSKQADKPYVKVNCGGFTDELAPSEFFGHVKGAFTGAESNRKGYFEMADGGTLFLDEIGEMPIEVQALLLRVLEGGRFMRVGGKEELRCDVRLVTATNRDLPKLVAEGKFREDLYQRLNVVQLRTPSLREHKEDIPVIANAWWRKFHGNRVLQDEQIAALMGYDYPGNVRELINILDRATALEEEDFDLLMREHKEMNAGLAGNLELKSGRIPDKLEDAIRIHVRRVYEKYRENLTRAAEALDVSRNTVRKYL